MYTNRLRFSIILIFAQLKLTFLILYWIFFKIILQQKKIRFHALQIVKKTVLIKIHFKNLNCKYIERGSFLSIDGV